MRSSESSFAAIVRRAYLYIGNVNPNVEKEAVVKYVADNCPDFGFDIEELPLSDGARTRSFKLTADFKMLETINKPEFWPQGIVVRRFFRGKREQGKK